MFEKEAEEYYNGQYDAWLEGEDSFALEEEIEQAFKDGAEFGYNKANEWHYPSKGELPKTKKKVLVLLKDVEEPILDYYRQDGLWNYALEAEVIAWKEIVIPELKDIE